MLRGTGRLAPLALALLLIGTLAGLFAARQRWRVEEGNRRIELALEWNEVSALAQVSQKPIASVLASFQFAGVTTLVISEDSLAGLEQTGAVKVIRGPVADGTELANAATTEVTKVEVDSDSNLHRIKDALTIRGIPTGQPAARGLTIHTTFVLSPTSNERLNDGRPRSDESLYVTLDYPTLRTLGLGLPPEAVRVTLASGMRIAGRIGNFAGVTVASAQTSLQRLKAQGASLVIFNGDEVLGYRDLEKNVASMLRDPLAPSVPANTSGQDTAEEVSETPTGLVYGTVEFGKQRGDETLSAALHGDYVRVHTIQSTELATLTENEAVERFTLAARERNIRFCYIRLLTTSGSDALDKNVEFLSKIQKGIAHYGFALGGGYEFGAARRYTEPKVPRLIFGLIGLGTAAGVILLLSALCPLSIPKQNLLAVGLGIFCTALAFLGGETGRRLIALLAGIAYPAAACLLVFPQSKTADRQESQFAPALPIGTCITDAVRGIALASAVTALGIIEVVGLLASRPFMLRASQFLGIKAQHGLPMLIVAVVALTGGVAMQGESAKNYRLRVMDKIKAILDEPAQFGILLLLIVALAAFLLVVARTGNDAGVGVSGVELKMRAILDRFLVVRPRTKEFMIGHPAFILALCWWARGRRKLALPCFVIGSIGQVSLLNTFCHIHTPLIASIWRDGLGLVIGTVFGVLLFLIGEKLLPAPFDASIKPFGRTDR